MIKNVHYYFSVDVVSLIVWNYSMLLLAIIILIKVKNKNLNSSERFVCFIKKIF